MAFYSFGRVKIVSRNGVKSAVATAAYHAGAKFTNEYDGLTHDHTRKKNVGETFIRMPESAPAAWRDESVPAIERLGVIWNDVEKASPAQNARLARTNYLALPHILTVEQGLACVDRWIERNCTSRGMGVTYTLHDKPNNRHVDVMYLVNEYDAAGKPKFKAKKEYLCRNGAGEEQYMDAATFRASSGWEKVYKYQKNGERRDMTPSEAAEAPEWERINKHPVCRTVPVGGWDESSLADDWRKSWEVVLNEMFEELGIDDRVDCRSYRERGLLQLPTKHEGWGPDQAKNREENVAIRQMNQELEGLLADANEVIADIQDQIDDLQQYQQTPESLALHEQDYKRNHKILVDLRNSNLLGEMLSDQLRSILAELHHIIIGLLQRWKERLFGTDKSADEILDDAKRRSGAVSEGTHNHELEETQGKA